MGNDRTFEYLLNAMERAAQEENPAEHGYAAKRKAVFDYVRRLEEDSLLIDAVSQPGSRTRVAMMATENCADPPMVRWAEACIPRPQGEQVSSRSSLREAIRAAMPRAAASQPTEGQ